MGETESFLSPRRAAGRGISLFPGANQREIPRFARNDKNLVLPQFALPQFTLLQFALPQSALSQIVRLRYGNCRQNIIAAANFLGRLPEGAQAEARSNSLLQERGRGSWAWSLTLAKLNSRGDSRLVRDVESIRRPAACFAQPKGHSAFPKSRQLACRHPAALPSLA